jgi:hypothetical protein
MVSAVMMAPSWEESTSASSESLYPSEECTVEPETLQSIFVIERHSAIGATTVLPKAPLDSQCVFVPGQVTAAGTRQTKEIVDVLKRRYGSFLPTNASQAFFRSTNLDRTLASISIKINCLLPTIKGAIPPIFFNPSRSLDGLYYGSYCPAGDEEIYYTNLETPAAAAFNQTNAKLIAYLASKTGLTADINIIETVYDYLASLKYNGCRLPSFYSDKLFAVIESQVAALYNLYYSSDLAQTLRGGPLAQELLKRIDYFLRATNQDSCNTPQIPLRKLHVYETHSNNIGAFLIVLGQTLTEPVRTGATLIAELHLINGEYFLRFYYLGDTESTPFGPIQTLTLSGSTKNGIRLDNFKALVTPHIPTNFDYQCQIPCTFDYHQSLEDFVSETNDNAGSLSLVYE